MNVNDLTIGEAKQLAVMFGGTQDKSQAFRQRVLDKYIGSYVIVRSRNEGINAGTVVALDHTAIVLKDARRLWFHKPAVKTESWYEGVANHGLSEDSKISSPALEKAIVEDYSITLCSIQAESSIRSAASHAES